jgi:voltage-gated potassium channel Kch
MLAKPKSRNTPVLVVAIAFVALVACLTGGAVFYHLVEGLTVVDALYFTSMTLTTVGYGDFVPLTDAGKIFTSVYAFIGVGAFLSCVTILFQFALSRMLSLQNAAKKDTPDA